MSNNNGKKIVEIKENDAAKVPATTPETNGQQTPAEEDVKYTFGYCLRHPIKALKHAAKEHPVATSVAGVATVGVVGFGVKCLCEALGGEKTDEDDEELDDVLDDEDEDDEEEI